MKIINVARDFTRFPAGRYQRNGGFSGEEFRTRFLEEPLRNRETIRIELDGTIGYGSSFLEETFGGLVRSLHLPAEEILKHLEIDSNDPSLIAEIKQYITDAAR